MVEAGPFGAVAAATAAKTTTTTTTTACFSPTRVVRTASSNVVMVEAGPSADGATTAAPAKMTTACFSPTRVVRTTSSSSSTAASPRASPYRTISSSSTSEYSHGCASPAMVRNGNSKSSPAHLLQPQQRSRQNVLIEAFILFLAGLSLVWCQQWIINAGHHRMRTSDTIPIAGGHYRAGQRLRSMANDKDGSSGSMLLDDRDSDLEAWNETSATLAALDDFPDQYPTMGTSLSEAEHHPSKNAGQSTTASEVSTNNEVAAAATTIAKESSNAPARGAVATNMSEPVPAPTTAWCILHKNNTNPYFAHFPHAMESLSRCWSYFCRVREQYGPQVQCVIHVHSDIHWDWLAPWAHDLVNYSGCDVVDSAEPPYREMTEYNELDFDINNPFKTPWFERPHDAQLLKQQVLRHAKLPSNQENDIDTRSRKRKIGIVMRPPKRDRPDRAFLNLDKIIDALFDTFGNDNIVLTVADMNNMTMLEQAVYFSEQDVIVAVHGAALSNAIFMRTTDSTGNAGTLPGTAAPATAASLVEIFPDGWEFRMFQSMMQTCGNARHYSIAHNTSATPRYENDARHVDVRPNVTLVVDLVRQALDIPARTDAATMAAAAAVAADKMETNENKAVAQE